MSSWLSGPVMAKGHEDTACYRYPALLAQNDVGGSPGADERDVGNAATGAAERRLADVWSQLLE